MQVWQLCHFVFDKLFASALNMFLWHHLAKTLISFEHPFLRKGGPWREHSPLRIYIYIHIIQIAGCKDESGCKKKDCCKGLFNCWFTFKFQILAGIGKHQKCGEMLFWDRSQQYQPPTSVTTLKPITYSWIPQDGKLHPGWAWKQTLKISCLGGSWLMAVE